MNSENKSLVFKPIKTSNSIVIGGMIALGKTTLSAALIKKIPQSEWVPELEEGDQLTDLLLNKMYERTNEDLYSPLFQLFFVIKRFDGYRKTCNRKHLTIYDRSIFEDWLFAKININNQNLFNYYQGTFEGICNQIVYDCGVPKLYIILTGSWELFKERLYKRNRACEIDNFKTNEIYFHRLLEEYESYLVNTCKNFGINYLVCDASKPVETLVEDVLAELEKIEKREK